MTVEFMLNNKQIKFSDQEEFELEGIPLLWFIRENANLKGTKFGCGIGQCGACTVHVNGESQRSCLLPIEQINGKSITTIEGLSLSKDQLHPVQEAWTEIDVPQCGYCQAGQIMAVSSLLKKNPNPSDDYIERELTNICRCGTYTRIRKAIKIAANKMSTEHNT